MQVAKLTLTWNEILSNFYTYSIGHVKTVTIQKKFQSILFQRYVM